MPDLRIQIRQDHWMATVSKSQLFINKNWNKAKRKLIIDPVTSNLDNKIRKIDLDNKRLQLELELLQDKYQNLNNGIV